MDRLAPTELLLTERISGVQQTALAGLLVTTGLADRLDDRPRTAETLVGPAAARCADGGAHPPRRRRARPGPSLAAWLPGQSPDPRAPAPPPPLAVGPGHLLRLARRTSRPGAGCPRRWGRGRCPFARPTGKGCGSTWHAPTRRERSSPGRWRRSPGSTPSWWWTRRPSPASPSSATWRGNRSAAGDGASSPSRASGGCWWTARRSSPSPGAAWRQRGCCPRVELHAADVFQSVPHGLPAYVLKDVLHDWSDASAEQLLRVVRAAIAPGGRVLLVEVLTGPSPWRSWRPRWISRCWR